MATSRSRALDTSEYLPGASRLWLHTCELDHPSAVDFYRHMGFAVYDEQTGDPPDPDETFFHSLERAVRYSIPAPTALILNYPSNPTAKVADLDFYRIFCGNSFVSFALCAPACAGVYFVYVWSIN